MWENIHDFVKTCHSCQARKLPTNQPFGDMQSTVATRPLEILAIDFLGPISVTDSTDKHLITAVDVFSKFAFAKTVPHASAKSIAQFIVDDIFVGLPECQKLFCLTVVKRLQRK